MGLYCKRPAVFLSLFLLSACTQQTLSGKWRAVRFHYFGKMDFEKDRWIDLDSLDSSKSGKTAVLELKKDSSFLAASYGWLVPVAIPGWHFGDSLSGNWKLHAGTLTLQM